MDPIIKGVAIATYPRSTAFQFELITGEIWTATWTGATCGADESPIVRHVDTGDTRAVSDITVKWFAPLMEIAR